MVLVLGLLTTALAGSVEVRLGGGGSYSLYLSDPTGGSQSSTPWLRSAPTTVHLSGKNFSSADGSLKLASNSTATGCDAMGDFKETLFSWQAGAALFETIFRTYPELGAVVFEQRFPHGAAGTALDDPHASASLHSNPYNPTVAAAGLLSNFPAFEFGNATAESNSSNGPRAYVQLAGKGVPTSSGCQMGLWPPNATERTAWPCQGGGALDGDVPMWNKLSGGWEGAGAIAIFDELASNTLVLSPSSAFTTTQAVHADDVLAFGPRGSITTVPAGFGASVIAFAGTGVGRTLRQWGLALMRKGGKNPDLWQNDFSLNYLGYTTDNGAYNLRQSNNRIVFLRHLELTGIHHIYVLQLFICEAGRDICLFAEQVLLLQDRGWQEL